MLALARALAVAALLGLAAGQEFWVNDVAHGSPAFGQGGYQVFRNVRDFGCKGDGVTDDTACINQAISAGTRCGQNCGSATTSPAIVYFPAGQYLISSPIIMFYYTQLIGNARNRPTLIMGPTFNGIALLDSDPYLDGGAQWYTNQNNFFRQIRNFVIDTTRRDAGYTANGIHWQVAQATSLTNIKFNMPPNSQHIGVWMENGSGGYMSDLEFIGGLHGMWIGNQQFLTKNLRFENVQTAIYLLWNWQWTFKNVEITGCQVGIDMAATSGDTEAAVGSVLLIDSTISNTPIGILNHGNPNPGDNSGTLLLDNVRFENVPQAVADRNHGTVLNGGTLTVASWGRGSLYNDESGNGVFHTGDLPAPRKDPSLLGSDGRFFSKGRPQYENLSAGDFANVRDYGARGDGNTDDTRAIQDALDANLGNGKVVYFPHGAYVITDTIRVKSGVKMTGEIWSILMASGSNFGDWNNPRPMLRVGEPGDVGNVEISEFMFSTKGPAAGAVLVQWNIKGSGPGEAGIWDSHFRIGGYAGSQLQGAQCPKGQSYVPQCIGAFIHLHVTKTGSGYFENVWAWTADHDLDSGVGQGQVSLYTGRGVLVQSTDGPNWLYGTQSEHNVMYQYQLDNTRNVFLTMIQGETPYWQPAPGAPQPFPPNAEYNDPTYSECGGSNTCPLAWGLRSVQSSNVYLYGAGLYNFFNNYDQTCLNTESCQDAMVSLEGNTAFYGYNINTKASTNIITGANRKVLAKQQDNKNTFCQGVNAFLAQV